MTLIECDRDRNIAYDCTSHLSNMKTLQLAYSPKFIIVSWLDTGFSFKDPELRGGKEEESLEVGVLKLEDALRVNSGPTPQVPHRQASFSSSMYGVRKIC